MHQAAVCRRLAPIRQHLAAEQSQSLQASAPAVAEEELTSPFHAVPLFNPEFDMQLTPAMKQQMDSDGHLVLPGILAPDAVDRLIASMSKVQTISASWGKGTECATSPAVLALRRSHRLATAALLRLTGGAKR